MGKKKAPPQSNGSKARTRKPSSRPKSEDGQPPSPRIKVVDRPSHYKGIEQLVWADASSLDGNPENWKTHPNRQLESLDAQLDTVGWMGAYCYNLNTGRLIDGHGRQQTNFVRREGIVPVLIGRWSPEEERQGILHLDPVGAMFETDKRKYQDLIKRHRDELTQRTDQLVEKNRAQLDEINNSLDLHVKSMDYGAPESFLPSYIEDQPFKSDSAERAAKDIVNIDDVSTTLPGALDLKTWDETPFDAFSPDALFGIPNIRPDRLAPAPESLIPWVGPETPDHPSYFYIYGCAAIEKVRSPSMIVAFYTWDYKFESIWKDPRSLTARMLNVGIRAAISPNFTCPTGGPLAHTIWQIYRSRWITRFWQEAGINVIPDLQAPPWQDKDRTAVMLAGIPTNCPCLAVQLVTRSGFQDDDSYFATSKVDIFAALELLQPQSLLVYCSSKLPDKYFMGIPGDIPVIRVETWMSARQRAVKNKEYLSTGIASEKD